MNKRSRLEEMKRNAQEERATWSRDALWLISELEAAEAEVKRLRGLVTRALVCEGHCPTSWCKDARAALEEK